MFIDIEQLINLTAVQGIGPTRLRALVAHFRGTEPIFHASIKELTNVDGIDFKSAQKIKSYRNFQFGKQEFERSRRLGVDVIHFWSEQYPDNLRRIYDPPVLLYVKGKIQNPDRYAIAMVGTRLPSAYGKIVAEKISRELVQNKILIVSGLARGIDTICHQAAIRNGGNTYAVLGSGLDNIYPPENRKLAETIQHHGALISEYPLSAKPDAQNFPRRNRIISGLSLGTVVVEAGIKSGALLTANYALDQNREVFAIPGNITSKKSEGANQLVKLGAKLVMSANDIFAELEHALKPLLTAQANAAEKQLPLDLSETEKKVLAQLSAEPIHIDKLSEKLGKSTAEVLSLLLPLEFKDLVRQLPGTLFIKN